MQEVEITAEELVRVLVYLSRALKLERSIYVSPTVTNTVIGKKHKLNVLQIKKTGLLPVGSTLLDDPTTEIPLEDLMILLYQLLKKN